jgi:hypothetical protein
LEEQLLVVLVVKGLQVVQFQGLGPLEELQLAQVYPGIFTLKKYIYEYDIDRKQQKKTPFIMI